MLPGSLLFRHLVALPIGCFESRAAAHAVARVRELETIRQFVTSSALTRVLDVVFGLLFLGDVVGNGNQTWFGDNSAAVMSRANKTTDYLCLPNARDVAKLEEKH